MNYIVSCFPDEMAQSRRVGQCSDASCLVGSLKQKLGVPQVLLYCLGSLKFGSRSWCRALCFPLRSLSAVLCHSQFGSRYIQMAVLCGGLLCHCWCSGCVGEFVLPAVAARPGSHPLCPGRCWSSCAARMTTPGTPRGSR